MDRKAFVKLAAASPALASPIYAGCSEGDSSSEENRTVTGTPSLDSQTGFTFYSPLAEEWYRGGQYFEWTSTTRNNQGRSVKVFYRTFGNPPTRPQGFRPASPRRPVVCAPHLAAVAPDSKPGGIRKVGLELPDPGPVAKNNHCRCPAANSSMDSPHAPCSSPCADTTSAADPGARVAPPYPADGEEKT